MGISVFMAALKNYRNQGGQKQQFFLIVVEARVENLSSFRATFPREDLEEESPSLTRANSGGCWQP